MIGADHLRQPPHVKRWPRERALPRFLPRRFLGDSPCPVINRQERYLPVLDRLAIDPDRADESLGFPDPRTVVHASLVFDENLEGNFSLKSGQRQGAVVLAAIEDSNRDPIAEHLGTISHFPDIEYTTSFQADSGAVEGEAVERPEFFMGGYAVEVVQIHFAVD